MESVWISVAMGLSWIFLMDFAMMEILLMEMDVLQYVRLKIILNVNQVVLLLHPNVHTKKPWNLLWQKLRELRGRIKDCSNLACTHLLLPLMISHKMCFSNVTLLLQSLLSHIKLEFCLFKLTIPKIWRIGSATWRWYMTLILVMWHMLCLQSTRTTHLFCILPKSNSTKTWSSFSTYFPTLLLPFS